MLQLLSLAADSFFKPYAYKEYRNANYARSNQMEGHIQWRRAEITLQ